MTDTLIERLKAAVWMVGNMDTEQDKAAWWATFGPLWEEIGQDPRVQDWADREAAKKYPPLPQRDAHEAQ